MTVGSWIRESTRALFSWTPERRFAETRFCVLDVDVTGITIGRDRVTGVAVLPFTDCAFRVVDLHSLDVADVSTGRVSPEVAEALAKLIGDSPVVTYNVHFVRQMMRRAGLLAGFAIPDSDWIDLESAAGVVASEDKELTSMSHWLELMRQAGEHQHDAAYDVFVMAQMLQALLSYCEDAGLTTLESLIRLQRARAWLRRTP